MNKVELKFKGISEIAGNNKLGIIVLTDMDERREITVVCDRLAMDMFQRRLTKTVHTDNCLPEALLHLVQHQTDLKMEMHIVDLVEGQYIVALLNTDTLASVPIRASDAILLAFVSDIPLFIDEQLMLKQSVPYERPEKGLTVPLNTLNVEMLNEALEKAINAEQYEMASLLRDELRKRKIMDANKTDKENEGS